MGGIGTHIDIEPVDPPAGKKRSTPRALHTAISRAILDLIWAQAGYGAFRSTAGEYLAQERSDSGERDLWSASETELSWAFMDHAGCCSGSSQACWHWFHVSLTGLRDRWDKMAATRGWRITTPRRPAAAALFWTRYPLMSHGSQPLCIPPFAVGKLDWSDEWDGPFWDDGCPRPRLPDLGDEQRETVLHAAITGMCLCGVCQRIGPWNGWTRSPSTTLERAWLALANDDLLELAADVRTEVAGYDAWREEPDGPPALVRLSGRLVAPPLPWELAGMCHRRG